MIAGDHYEQEQLQLWACIGSSHPRRRRRRDDNMGINGLPRLQSRYCSTKHSAATLMLDRLSR